MSFPLKQKLRYKYEYWRRKILLFLGICPKCGTKVNYTTLGRPICPDCSR